MVELVHPGLWGETLNSDKAYHRRAFSGCLLAAGISQQVLCNNAGRAAGLDEGTTTLAHYRLRQKTRNRVDHIFGWIQTVGALEPGSTSAVGAKATVGATL